MNSKKMVAILMAFLLLSACGASEDADDDGGQVETTQPAESTQPDVEEPEEPRQATAPLPDASGTFDATADELTAQFQPLDPGTYLVETLGTPFTVTVPPGWAVQPNEAAWTVLTLAGSQGPGDRDIVLIRATDLSDPEDLAPPPEGALWPVDDISGWLDAVATDVMVGDLVETELGGREALAFDVTVGGGLQDAFFVDNSGVAGIFFSPGIEHRVFWVEQDGLAPVAVIVGGGSMGQTFLEEANAVLESLAFGEPVEHPIDPDVPLWEQGYASEVPAGTVRLPIAGGIQFELDEQRFVPQTPGSDLAAVVPRVDGEVGILVPKATPDGEPVDSADDVIDRLSEVATVTEAETTVVAGFETRVVDLTDGPPMGEAENMFATSTEDLREGWFAPPLARIWLIESNRGLLMIAAESFDDEAVLEATTAIAQGILDTLEFIEMGE